MANQTLANVKVNEIKWTGRAAAALANGGLMDKSLADLESMKDDELLSVSRLGRGSLGEIRQKTIQSAAKLREEKLQAQFERRNASQTAKEAVNEAPVTAKPEAAPTVAPAPQKAAQSVTVAEKPQKSDRTTFDPVMEFAKSHSGMITAIMNGEMILVPKL